jgi:hypothetical protein
MAAQARERAVQTDMRGWTPSPENIHFPKELRGETKGDLTLSRNEIKSKAHMHKKKTYGCIKLHHKLSLKKLRRSYGFCFRNNINLLREVVLCSTNFKI